MEKFHTASDKEIREGLTTDVYFKRTVEILRKKNITKIVAAEFTTTSLPKAYPWAVFAGLEYVVKLLEGLPINLFALKEGTIFTPVDSRGVPVPVIVIEGDYKEFAEYETPALGFICQGSGITTKASRIKKVAGDLPVLSFGVRRMHPAIAPFIDRNAFVGGCDGVSSILGAEAVQISPSGTMPHALMLVMGEDEAWRAFDDIISQDILRIALVDTFGDEKFEALKAAAMIKDLFGIRLDTPASRRGNFAKIVREVRWELDIRGYKDVKIYVSGGLDEDDIEALKEAGAYSFGVGTCISNAPTVDFAMDIVEIESKPVSKKGKFSGRKQVLRCENCLNTIVIIGEDSPMQCEKCGHSMVPYLTQYLDNGKLVTDLPQANEIRKFVLEQLKKVEL
ncbi:MAG TPA: nicotinate phosphoribosyltransferase [Candidatus Hydrothermia bacterium]|nr:nicotinate phosphoribosyltransferase [Candidatus Hydrothermia bacterium]HOK22931.1 nicotinate phosphoribosyltransferase [Candidatus Hydrothermia bacterium]HOL23640.1 nicotinate phosphoribosyltransferase [Candidatus Hydrothermia bacterium]HPO78646.1 nicotinate phosphoribosyltransferase [Candidatus Hydrothermia bacterium]